MVALDRKTLERKDWFIADGADFNASPMVIRYKDRDLVAVTGNDGRLYLLDGASLGGADHKTPLHVTAKYTAAGAGMALATWEDQGTRWILATAAGSAPAGRAAAGRSAAATATGGSVVAFQLVDQNGTLTLERGWTSRPLTSPLAPIVVNGVAFVASSGEFRGSAAGQLTAAQRAQRSVPAVLYALDAATGAELWNSGTDHHFVRPRGPVGRRRAGLPGDLRQHALRLRHSDGALIDHSRAGDRARPRAFPIRFPRGQHHSFARRRRHRRTRAARISDE